MNVVPFYDLGQQVRRYSGRLHEALDEVIAGGYFVGGEFTERFEREFADFVGTRHGIGTANGLDSIRLILEAYGIGSGDEVIVPAFTYYATWLGITQTGATPIPVDVDPATANLDASLVEQALSPRTRAILPVHLFGQAADVAALKPIATAHGLVIVEDAAQSHGAISTAGMTGAAGDAAAFSFYPTKNLGALGDAGGVTTDDDEIAARIRSRRSYGQGAHKYDHVDTGWNSRLDPIQAAFLSIHLERLPEWTARRRSIAVRYREALGERSSSVIGPQDPEGGVWHHFVLRAANRDSLRTALTNSGVTTDVHYPYAVHQLSPMRPLLAERSRDAVFPVAESLAQSVTSLPIGPWMTDEQVEQVAAALEGLPAALLTD